jgi:hypothetical protein
MLSRTAVLCAPSEQALASSQVQNRAKKSCLLLPLNDRSLTFLGADYSERAKRGAGGVQPGAPTESALSESSHGILFQIGLPYPAPGALKKRRASEPQRNPEPSANALSREFTAPYR